MLAKALRRLSMAVDWVCIGDTTGRPSPAGQEHGADDRQQRHGHHHLGQRDARLATGAALPSGRLTRPARRCRRGDAAVVEVEVQVGDGSPRSVIATWRSTNSQLVRLAAASVIARRMTSATSPPCSSGRWRP